MLVRLLMRNTAYSHPGADIRRGINDLEQGSVIRTEARICGCYSRYKKKSVYRVSYLCGACVDCGGVGHYFTSILGVLVSGFVDSADGWGISGFDADFWYVSGPTGLFMDKDFYDFLKKLVNYSESVGGVVTTFFAADILYMITDLEDAVTAANACSYKPPLYKLAEPYLGRGLLTASGPLFHTHRRLLNPAFSLSVIYGFLGVFNKHSKRLTDLFEDFVGKGPVDTTEAFKDVVLRSSVNTILGTHDEKDSEFINKYTKAINDVLEVVKIRFLTIRYHKDFLYKLSSEKKRSDELTKIVNDLTQKTIERKKEEMKNKAFVGKLSEADPGFRSFVDIMMDIAADGSLSDEEIKAELNTVAGASYETTSRQLVYILVVLGTYPEIQEKVFKEIMEVVGDRDVEKADIPKMVYLDAFLKECLRVVPVTNMLPRYVHKDVKLKNYTLRAGSQVSIIMDGLHRQPSWGDDYEVFNPDRFLNKGKQLDNLSFAFGYGERVCVGKKYAMVSMKVALVHVIRKYWIKGDFSKLKLKFDLMSGPESGHEIIVEKREGR